jgi:hypothetical protein
LQYKSRKRRKSSSNSRTQKPTSKKNPKNSKPRRKEIRKNLLLSKLNDREQFF